MCVAAKVCTVLAIYRKISRIYRRYIEKKRGYIGACGRPMIFYLMARNDL